MKMINKSFRLGKNLKLSDRLFHFKNLIVIFAANLNKDDKSQLYFNSQFSTRYSTLGAGLRMVCVYSNNKNDIKPFSAENGFFTF